MFRLHTLVCFTVFFTQLNANGRYNGLDAKITNDDLAEKKSFQIDDKFYTIVTYAELDVLGAIHFCSREGQQLISLESQKENEEVFTMLQSSLAGGGVSSFWSSAHRIGPQDWTWVSTGKPVNITNWIEDSPSKDGSKDCVTLQYTSWGVSTGWWYDSYCNVTRNFICESKEC